MAQAWNLCELRNISISIYKHINIYKYSHISISIYKHINIYKYKNISICSCDPLRWKMTPPVENDRDPHSGN